VENTGQLQQFYIEDSNPAIIEPDMWEAVQLEMARRKEYATKHNIQKLEYASNKFPFGGRVICGKCGGVYGRKIWNSTNDRLKRIIWQCNGRYAEKGVVGCTHNHIDEKHIFKAFVECYNTIIENKEHFTAKWQGQMGGEDILAKVTAIRFIDIFANAVTLTEFDIDLYFKLVDKFVVIDKGSIKVCLLDGTELECEIE
jgi:site-specific DNA recombinase